MPLARHFLVALALTSLVGCWLGKITVQSSPEPNPWAIRSDFSNDDGWSTVRELISAPQRDELSGMEFFAYVDFVSDEKYRDKEPREIVLSLPDDYDGFECFVVDKECIENDEHPVLVVGFDPPFDAPGEAYHRPPRETPLSDIKTFRALPSQIPGIENNLSIGNMDFEEFANCVDEDGVFRAIPHP